MTVSKAVLTFAQSITVDTTETPGLPDLVKTAYRTGGAAIPIVIFTDPGITQIFAIHRHPEMASQKFDQIFQPTKQKIQESKDQGTFNLGEAAPQKVAIKDPKIESWKSSHGTEIKAKLLAIEDDAVFVFETADGKSLRATANQLDPASVTRARQLAQE